MDHFSFTVANEGGGVKGLYRMILHGIAEQFDTSQPCTFSHNMGEYGIIAVTAVFSGGTTGAGNAAAKALQKSLNVLNKLDILGSAIGKGVGVSMQVMMRAGGRYVVTIVSRSVNWVFEIIEREGKQVWVFISSGSKTILEWSDAPAYALALPDGSIRGYRMSFGEMFSDNTRKLMVKQEITDKAGNAIRSSNDSKAIVAVVGDGNQTAVVALRELDEMADKAVKAISSKLNEVELQQFMRDFSSNTDLLVKMSGDDLLLDAWKVVFDNPNVRKSLASLENIKKILDNSHLSRAGFTKTDLSDIIKKLNQHPSSYSILSKSNDGLEKFIAGLNEINRIKPQNVKKIIAGLKSNPPELFGELFRMRACEEIGWANVTGLEKTALKDAGGADRYIDIVVKGRMNIETKYYATFEKKTDEVINAYLKQVEKDIESGKPFEHWFGRTQTITSQEQLHKELSVIFADYKYINDYLRRTGKTMDDFIKKYFYFKNFNQ